MNAKETFLRIEKSSCCPMCGNDADWVELRPYQNQVSGHHRVMILDEETICKPLMSKEYAFFQNVPTEILKFVPKMKGNAKVFAQTDDNGHDHLFAIPKTKESVSKLTCDCKDKNMLVASATSTHGLAINNQCKWKYKAGQDESNSEQVFDQHPWVKKVQQMSFEKNMHKTKGSELILLEHIGARFKRPCIMDLKMGVRQHGDDATEIKIKDHQERCEMSTSSSLGVRLCGMQVYDPACNTYTYTDKYSGRRLDDSGFEESLKHFINDCKRPDVIPVFVESLEDLYGSVQSLNSCRLFCSSLLLMYEGDITAKVEPVAVLRMIDFANVTLYSEKHIGPDEGYLFGLRNLIRLFREIAVPCK